MRLFPWNRTVLLNVCHVPSSCHSGSTHIQTAARQQKYGNNNCLLASKPSIHPASQQSASSMTITTTSSSNTIIKNEYKMVVFGVERRASCWLVAFYSPIPTFPHCIAMCIVAVFVYVLHIVNGAISIRVVKLIHLFRWQPMSFNSSIDLCLLVGPVFQFHLTIYFVCQ